MATLARTVPLLLYAMACSAPGRGAPAQAQPITAFTNVTVIDGTDAAPAPGMTVVVEGRRIAVIAPTAAHTMPADARIIDGTGKFLIPGLIDAHIHLGTMPNRSREITEAILGNAFMGGVTTVRDMGGQMGTVRPLAARAAHDSVPWPRVLYSALMAGPGSWFEGARGAFMAEGRPIGTSPLVRLITDTTDIVAAIREAKAAGAHGIKVYNDVPLPTLSALAAEARRQDLRVWGHMAIAPVRPSEAIEAGIEVLSHADQLIAEMLPYARRGTPLDSARAARHRMFLMVSDTTPALRGLVSLMREREVFYDPTLFIMTPGPDSTGRVPEQAAALYRFATTMTRSAHRAGVPIITGTDALGGSTPNLHVELQLLTDTIGMSTAEVLRAATSVGARALGISDSLGTVEAGMVADVVLLDQDPLDDIANTQTVTGVMKGGVWYPRDAPMRPIPRARPPRRD